MKLKKLPIGISTFKDIITENYAYVDKTKIALELIETGGGYYFLSRPKRFGKSLFLDTLRTIFDGEKELFKGLYIYDKYEFKKYPVLYISFNNGKFSAKEDLNQYLYELMDNIQQDLGVTCPKDFSLSGCFSRIIEETYRKYNQKVVILVDEYDKPVMDNIENTEIAALMGEELKSFYSVIKGADEYLKFAFLTGVSKFSKASLFSGLNNLEDITLNLKYATICGYTQRDVETVFAKHLEGQDFEKIKHWYNGYKFLGEGVYNPFDILLFISNGFAYRNYWFSTGTPTFLLKLIEKNNYFLPNLEYIVKGMRMLDSFDVDYIELETLMWQTGYLTIDSYKETSFGILYTLKIPNHEVRVSLFSSIADYISRIQNSEEIQDRIYEALLAENFKSLETGLTSLFASIPYNLNEYEGYYVSVFYAYVMALGVEVIAEDVTNKGRIDLTLKLPENIFIFEFKTGGGNALQQIKDKKYHEKYLGSNLPIYHVGVEFDEKLRNVSKVEFEKVLL